MLSNRTESTDTKLQIQHKYASCCANFSGYDIHPHGNNANYTVGNASNVRLLDTAKYVREQTDPDNSTTTYHWHHIVWVVVGGEGIRTDRTPARLHNYLLRNLRQTLTEYQHSTLNYHPPSLGRDSCITDGHGLGPRSLLWPNASL